MPLFSRLNPYTFIQRLTTDSSVGQTGGIKEKEDMEDSAGDPSKLQRACLAEKHSPPKLGCGPPACNLSPRALFSSCVSWFCKLPKLVCRAPKRTSLVWSSKDMPLSVVSTAVLVSRQILANTQDFTPAKSDQSPSPRRGHRGQAKIQENVTRRLCSALAQVPWQQGAPS